MHILYDFIFVLFSIVYLPYLLVTRRYHARLFERLGIFGKGFFKQMGEGRIVWLHAVSVGEVMAAAPFINGFHSRFPGYKLLISTVTRTGNSVASRIKGKDDALIYFPLDLSFVIMRLLARLRVKLFIVMETEIWPNIITAFYKKGIPVMVINGRLSQRSFRAYKTAAFLMRPIFAKISMFCVQTRDDGARLEELGVDRRKIRITGNMKYDVSPSRPDASGGIKRSMGIPAERKILVAGSTHRGEDEIILDAYEELLKKFSSLSLLIAPRHIERTDEIGRLIVKRNLKWARFSSLRGDSWGGHIIVLDVIGRLSGLYSIADIVLIGGSLLPAYGGHNLLEPAVLKKAILFGPHMSNFKDMAAEFLEGGAALQVAGPDELKNRCDELLRSPLVATGLGEAAFNIIEKNRGASQKNMRCAESILSSGVMDR